MNDTTAERYANKVSRESEKNINIRLKQEIMPRFRPALWIFALATGSFPSLLVLMWITGFTNPFELAINIMFTLLLIACYIGIVKTTFELVKLNLQQMGHIAIIEHHTALREVMEEVEKELHKEKKHEKSTKKSDSK